MRVVQASHREGLAGEAGADLVVLEVAREQDLERDGVPEADMLGREDGRHPPYPDQPGHAVAFVDDAPDPGVRVDLVRAVDRDLLGRRRGGRLGRLWRLGRRKGGGGLGRRRGGGHLGKRRQ